MEELQEEIRQRQLNELMAEYEKHVGTADGVDALTGNNYDEQKEVALYGEAGVGRSGQADRKGQSGNIDTGRGEPLRRSVQDVYEGKTVYGWPGQLTQENILGEEPVRVWVSSGIVEPRQGSVAHAEQQLAKEYNIPCFVVADKVWEQNKGAEFSVGRSIGAKSHNYDVVDKETGEIYSFAEGSKIQNAEIFAGAGAHKPLKAEVSEGLAGEFGGNPDDWQHAKGVGQLTQDGDEIRVAEVHWFQAKGIGKVKFKVKRWMDE